MRETDAALVEGADEFEAGDDARRPVEAAAVGHRVGMRADEDRAAGGIGARGADEIAGGIDAAGQACLLETAAQKGASFGEERREGPAGPGARDR